MKPGRFITFEGGEGVGKSTQARLLKTALEQRGIPAILTREPGGTAGAEAIRELLLNPQWEGQGWNARSEALLFAAARADHVAKVIQPALNCGQWVLCDRFIDSTRAYQGGAGGVSDDDILALHRFGSQGVMPAATLLMELPAAVTSGRLLARDGPASDRIGGRGADYHAKVAATFRQIADAEPDRFIRIDGAGSPAEIHERIWAAVSPLLGRSA